MSTCIFCEIASGKAQAQFVHQTERCAVFLDTAPIREGHVQIIPRDHYACFDDMPPDLACEIMRLGQRVARALKAQYKVARAGFVYSGNDVAHAHAHVLPLFETDDITSARYYSKRPVQRRVITPPTVQQAALTAQELQFELGAV